MKLENILQSLLPQMNYLAEEYSNQSTLKLTMHQNHKQFSKKKGLDWKPTQTFINKLHILEFSQFTIKPHSLMTPSVPHAAALLFLKENLL